MSLPTSSPPTRSPQKAQRVGVLGGAFDPPHAGHLALARAALAELQLDALHIVPTGQAWHKATALSDAAHRLAMAQLAFGALPGVLVDPRETLRSGPSYTVDTLAELQAHYPGAQLLLIIGQDQARAITTWHDWQRVLQLAIICVAIREDDTRPTGQNHSKFVAPAGFEARFQSLQLAPLRASSTAVRARVAAQLGAGALVIDGVARYIDDHHLYQTH